MVAVCGVLFTACCVSYLFLLFVACCSLCAGWLAFAVRYVMVDVLLFVCCGLVAGC